MKKKQDFEIKTATQKEVINLNKLSTERLIIWIIGKSKEIKKKFSTEDIVIECWLINPEKHSLRGYNEFPDSHNIIKRIYEMKGKKGLLVGSEMSGFKLTDISQSIYADLKELVKMNNLKEAKGYFIADRTISSIDEAPYKRLIKTPVYIKFKENRKNEIVEMDFLYFYGINWHSRSSYIQNRIKNTDTIVQIFAEKDSTLKEVHKLLNEKFKYVKEKLLKKV